ncbi:MAG: hypothetical protein WAT12_00180 [Candidatus Nitrotoga sp.]
MNPKDPPPLEDTKEKISALIETLHRTGQRLEELTAGEVDAVTDRDGRPFLLRRAQDRLRQSETAILNALPAHIALLDSQGLIISVNEAWRRFASMNAILGQGMGSASITLRFAIAHGEMAHPRLARPPQVFDRCWEAG